MSYGGAACQQRASQNERAAQYFQIPEKTRPEIFQFHFSVFLLTFSVVIRTSDLRRAADFYFAIDARVAEDPRPFMDKNLAADQRTAVYTRRAVDQRIAEDP